VLGIASVGVVARDAETVGLLVAHYQEPLALQKVRTAVIVTFNILMVPIYLTLAICLIGFCMPCEFSIFWRCFSQYSVAA
jgi:hypothetical protein